MAEFKLSYTASEINEKLGKVATPDWNASEGEAGYVKNRTHYEETTIVNEPLTITWDGNTEGLVGVMDMFFKVSDLVLTDEQIKTATITGSNGASFYIGNIWEMMVSEGWVAEDYVLLSGIMVVVRKDNLDVSDLTFPQKGIYFFISSNDEYIASLTITEPVEQTKTVVKKLDKKFLPDDVGGIKYVTIDMDDNGNYTASATYAQISEWIMAGNDVRCVYGNYIMPLLYSDTLSEVRPLMGMPRTHRFANFTSMLGYERKIYETFLITEINEVIYETLAFQLIPSES